MKEPKPVKTYKCTFRNQPNGHIHIKLMHYAQFYNVYWAYTLYMLAICPKQGIYTPNIEKIRSNLGILNRFLCYIPNYKENSHFKVLESGNEPFLRQLRIQEHLAPPGLFLTSPSHASDSPSRSHPQRIHIPYFPPYCPRARSPVQYCLS